MSKAARRTLQYATLSDVVRDIGYICPRKVIIRLIEKPASTPHNGRTCSNHVLQTENLTHAGFIGLNSDDVEFVDLASALC